LSLYSKLLIIIPAHNESYSISQVVSSLISQEYEVLVIDDASTDDTAEIALREGAKVMSLVNNLGAWGATQAGLRYANRNAYEMVLTMDADGQHLPGSIPDFLLQHAKREFDVSIGAYPERGSAARRIAWHFFRKLSRLTIADLTSGLRIYNRHAIELLSSPAASLIDYQDIGVLIMLNSSGLALGEIPVKMEERSVGKSRIFGSWWHVFTYMLHTTILCLIKINFSKKRQNAY
jgi:glycosyltransferase involved in cell wall biosynthesis